jgi:hypothetical protein
MEINNDRYLFLDIDGVLATTTQYYSNKKKWHPAYDCYRFDEKCVKVFNEILSEFNDIIIILSSDWKLHYDLKEMNDIFNWNGVNAKVIGKTPSSWGVEFKSLQQLEQCRAYEIMKYVETHNVQNYVAVDDLDLTPWMPEGRFVCTPRANEGIKQNGIKQKIITILNNKTYGDN